MPDQPEFGPVNPATPQAWERLDRKLLIDRWWMTLYEDRVRLPHGVVIEEYHVAQYPEWALALCLSEDGQAVMVEQYRYALERPSLEFASGMIQPGEEPLAGARRELLEETGYASDKWISLGRSAPDPSRHTNYAHFFVALNARRVRAPEQDATEDLRVRLVAPTQLAELVENETIIHGSHQAAIFWAIQKGLLPNPDAR